MKKMILVLFLLVPITLIFAQEKKFQISVLGEFFSPNNSDYQAIAVVNKNLEQTIGGSASGYGTGVGGAINISYFFYKGIGASLDWGLLSFENKLVYEVASVQHKYKNTMDYQYLKIGPVGRTNLGESNFELQSSIGLAVVFADFFKIHDVGSVYDHLDGEASTFLGAYFRIGASYRIIEMVSVYADYEYSIIPAEYSFNGALDGDEREILISNSDVGGSSIRFGLAFHF